MVVVGQMDPTIATFGAVVSLSSNMFGGSKLTTSFGEHDGIDIGEEVVHGLGTKRVGVGEALLNR